MTIKEYIEYVDRFEYSQEYFDILKESYEVSLMDRYIENQEAMMEYPSFFEGCTFLMENVGTDKTSDLKEKNDTKKVGLLKRIWRIIVKALNSIYSFIKRLFSKGVNQSKDISKKVEEISREYDSLHRKNDENGLKQLSSNVSLAMNNAFNELQKTYKLQPQLLSSPKPMKKLDPQESKDFIAIAELLKKLRIERNAINQIYDLTYKKSFDIMREYPYARRIGRLLVAFNSINFMIDTIDIHARHSADHNRTRTKIDSRIDNVFADLEPEFRNNGVYAREILQEIRNATFNDRRTGTKIQQNIEDIRRIQENFTDLIEYNDNTLLEQLRKVGYSIEKFMDFMTKIQRYVTDTISAYNLINQSIQQEMYILNKHLSIFRDTGNKLKEYDKDYETPMQ